MDRHIGQFQQPINQGYRCAFDNQQIHWIDEEVAAVLTHGSSRAVVHRQVERSWLGLADELGDGCEHVLDIVSRRHIRCLGSLGRRLQP